MSIATLEKTILAEAKARFQNRKLRIEDLMEWSTAEIEPQEGEVVAFLSGMGVWVAIRAELDRSVSVPG